MEKYTFSPVKNKKQLMEAVRYIHLKCSELCKKNFGEYLPVAGNIGIFCHYDDEYEFLTKLREELTDRNDNWNKKYYRLYEPITISDKNGIPGATYTYLYVRKPDQHTEVGDVDFVLDAKEYNKLKESLIEGKKIKGIEILDRPELDLIRLYDSDIDTLSFIGKEYINESVNSSAK